MSQYKVLKEFKLDGEDQAVGKTLELESDVAEQHVQDGNLEAVDAGGDNSDGGSSE